MLISRSRGSIRRFEVYAIKDLDALVAAVHLRQARAVVRDGSRRHSPSRDQPRPRHTFVLLDRPMPRIGRRYHARCGAAPGGHARYLRPANRPARAAGVDDRQRPGVRSHRSRRSRRSPATRSARSSKKKSIGSVSPTEQALNWRWHPPRDTPPEVAPATDRRRTPRGDRRALAEAAATGACTAKRRRKPPAIRSCAFRCLASLLILEQGGNSDRDADSIAELRRDLNLPQPEAIDPTGEPD